MKDLLSKANLMRRLFIDMPVVFEEFFKDGFIFIHKLFIPTYHLFLTNIIFT